jgi:MYXO-CTERM domain-containing protein
VCDETGENCTPICGDSLLRAPETCDNANTNSDDGCSNLCVIEEGYVCDVASEPCDAVCGDSMESACFSVCGDGLLVGAEACDDGNTDDSDGCSAVCGIEEGWVCEPTISENPEDPASVCETTCGDGAIAGDETCDDLNLELGDGCNDVCTIEDGWSCSEEPSVCEEGIICGDGRLGAGEGCDDGNTDATDGCSDVCQVEDGWECELVEGASVCEFIDEDGDGVTDAVDNCVSVSNADQADFDEDGFSDVCDNCPNDANPDQLDSNEDGVGDACTEDEEPEDAGGDTSDDGDTSDAGSEDTSTDVGVDSSSDVAPDSTPDAEADTTDPNGPISGGGLSGCSSAPAGNGTAPLALGFLMVFGALIRRRRAA